MKVILEVGSSSQLLWQQLEAGKDHQVPMLGHSRATLLGFAATV